MRTNSDRATERGLAHPGRTHETQDWSARVTAELAHAQVLEDAFLDLTQVRVILIQDVAGVDEVEPVGRAPRPGQLHHPVEIAAHDLGLGPLRVHALHPAQLAHGLGQRLARQTRLFHLGPVLLRLLEARVRLAELVLDRAKLLAQEGLALAAVHLVVGL
jgi:hypothetical protein